MSYKFSFADNTTYSAADVNAITQRLVTSGVADSFADGVAYNMSKFNEEGCLLYTSGVVPESCETLKVVASDNNKILIYPGLAFFSDGAVIEIQAGGETLSYVSGSKNYVYLKNELADLNTCYPCCTTEEPEGDYVLLAEIDENGTITDKRTYATGKLPYGSVADRVLAIEEDVSFELDGNGGAISPKAVEFDIGGNTYKYILVYNNTDSNKCLGLYDIENSSYLSLYGTKYTNDCIVASTYSTDNSLKTWLYFSVADGTLTVTCCYDNKRNNSKTCGIKLILF